MDLYECLRFMAICMLTLSPGYGLNLKCESKWEEHSEVKCTCTPRHRISHHNHIITWSVFSTTAQKRLLSVDCGLDGVRTCQRAPEFSATFDGHVSVLTIPSWTVDIALVRCNSLREFKMVELPVFDSVHYKPSVTSGWEQAGYTQESVDLTYRSRNPVWAFNQGFFFDAVTESSNKRESSDKRDGDDKCHDPCYKEKDSAATVGTALGCVILAVGFCIITCIGYYYYHQRRQSSTRMPSSVSLRSLNQEVQTNGLCLSTEPATNVPDRGEEQARRLRDAVPTSIAPLVSPNEDITTNDDDEAYEYFVPIPPPSYELVTSSNGDKGLVIIIQGTMNGDLENSEDAPPTYASAQAAFDPPPPYEDSEV